MKEITLKDIEQALVNIQSYIEPTPLSFSRNCTELVGVETYLKFENYQRTGSFKIRGALNKMLSLTEEEKQRGVIASSAGNHAQGVALACKILGIECCIVMPENSPIVKAQATESYGGKVILHGEMYDDSYEYALKRAKEENLTFIHPYQDEKIIAGQGTMALEVLKEQPDLDSIVVSIGGGGMASGVAIAIKALRPQCRVIGVVPELSSAVERLFNNKEGEAPFSPSIADGTSVKNPSPEMFDNYISKYLDEIVMVSEAEIAQSVVFLLERAKTVVEGSGALPLAAAIHRDLNLGSKTCILLSGGNIDLNLMNKAINIGLAKSGRIVRLEVLTSDRPGELNMLTGTIASLKANILEVQHERIGRGIEIRKTKISFLLETKNQQHLDRIKKALVDAGASIQE